MKKILLLVFACVHLNNTFGQKINLNYYLPEENYLPSITKPSEFLGFEVGEQHASHDQVYHYMKWISTQSPRVKMIEYARSYENRPLVSLVITSEANHQKLNELKNNHVAWASGDKTNLKEDEIPLVFYQGYSIHGNESSGVNAALVMAYYLTASQHAETKKLLDQTIILFDPCYNPDGVHRFSTWVNAHKSKNLVSDAASRELNEPWPRGRFNHYWFDLNRDWMPQQLPESKGRIKLFQEWKPNLLTDHHEMGSNASFFFMPGEPTRVNPNTPKQNQDLTREIAKYHAASLNSIGSLYYTREGYDDYYYGKGSTYPDVNGAVGILFEQASSRGHAQQTDNGILTFPFTIRNQVRAAFSSYKACVELKSKLLQYQRDFYKTASEEAAKDPIKGYLISAPNDAAKMNQLIDILLANKVKIHALKDHRSTFTKTESYVIPCDQPQYRLVKGMFEKRTKFEDSLFYDISAWSYLLAFNLQYQELTATDEITKLTGNEVTSIPKIELKEINKSSYAYLMEWTSYYAPKALYQIVSKGLRARVLHDPTTIPVGNGKQTFSKGSILIPVQNQAVSADEIYILLKEISKNCMIPFQSVETGFAAEGIDLGSPSSSIIKQPKLTMIIGDGIDPVDAGEIWHLLDTRMDMPLTMVDHQNFNQLNLTDYTDMILVDGVYNLNAAAVAKIKTWVNNGGNITAMGRSINWLHAQGLADVSIKPTPGSFDIKSGDTPMRKYEGASADAGTDQLAGAIFETRFDASHPLLYGYSGNTLPLFKSNKVFLDIPKNAYASPIRYTANPLLSGYVSKINLDQIKNSAAVVINGSGSGKIICIPDNLNFRAFWYGTNKLLMNAIFFGDGINPNTVQRVVQRE